MFHIPMICILWPYLIYVHMQIILDGMENFHPEQVAIDSIATDDVAIVPLFIWYSFHKHMASIVDDFPNKKKTLVTYWISWLKVW